MFATIDRYVLREVAMALAGVTVVLLAILVSYQVARILGIAADRGFPQEIVFALIGLTTLENLMVLVPISMLLAAMLALGRLYHESEMAAVRACGIGPERLYLPVYTLALPVAIGLAWLTFVVGPDARNGAEESQLRHLSRRTGWAFDDPRLLALTRSSNSMDMALLVRDLVALLDAYAAARARHDGDARLALADAIVQGLSADPELLLTRLDLLEPSTMIEELFVDRSNAARGSLLSNGRGPSRTSLAIRRARGAHGRVAPARHPCVRSGARRLLAARHRLWVLLGSLFKHGAEHAALPVFVRPEPRRLVHQPGTPAGEANAGR